jgi:uncharacterized membrane protein
MATTGQPEERTIELERLIFFSDAVFAIAITLLVIDIKVPEISEGQAAAELANRVRDLYPNILSYVISFLVIATYWLAHHRLFSYIRRYDRRLLWLNLYFLMFIAFLPFPTGILGRYGDTFFATTFYIAFQVVIGLLLALLWTHATRGHRLVDPDLDSRVIRVQTARLLAMPVIFALSIGVAAFNANAGKFFWLLFLAARPIIARIARNVPDDD